MTAVAKLPEISTFIEQMDMLRDDFVKYQDGNKSVPFVVLRDALVAALNAYDDARASLSPAELGGVELQRWSVIADGTGGVEEFKNVSGRWVKYSDVAPTPRAAEGVTATSKWDGQAFERAYATGYRAALGAAAAECRKLVYALDHGGREYVRPAEAMHCLKAVNGLRVPQITPDDFVLAPKEPTPEMVECVRLEILHGTLSGRDTADVYRTMIQALTPPSAKGEL